MWQSEGMAIEKNNIHSDKPATKGDIEQLREDLQADLQAVHSEVQGDMEQLRENLQDDLQEVRSELQADMVQLEERIIKRMSKQFQEWGSVLFAKIDAVVENRQIDLGAAKSEQVQMLVEKVEELDGRVRAIELPSQV